MSINMSDDKNIPADAEACYEAVASQEEIYLEETEEELRASLIFYDPPRSQATGSILPESCQERESDRDVERSMTDTNNNSPLAESPDEQINHAAEELITGDSDDSPLSEEEVVEMLNDSHAQRSNL